MQPERVSSEQKGQEKLFSALDGVPQCFEWLFTRLDGTPFYSEVTLNRLSLEGKTLLQAIIRDVSERKSAEIALLESEKTYRRVVEDQAELITRFLPDGTHIFVNKAYCRYFNKTREDIIGKKFFPGSRRKITARSESILHR